VFEVEECLGEFVAGQHVDVVLAQIEVLHGVARQFDEVDERFHELLGLLDLVVSQIQVLQVLVEPHDLEQGDGSTGAQLVALQTQLLELAVLEDQDLQQRHCAVTRQAAVVEREDVDVGVHAQPDFDELEALVADVVLVEPQEFDAHSNGGVVLLLVVDSFADLLAAFRGQVAVEEFQTGDALELHDELAKLLDGQV